MADSSFRSQPSSNRCRPPSSSRPRPGHVPSFEVSRDELARTILLRVFRKAAPLLGLHARYKLERFHGEKRWLEVASERLSPRMRAKLQASPSVLEHDIYIITELIMANLELVCLPPFRGIDGACAHSRCMQAMVTDLDCLSRTRTWLFHGVQVSVYEALRCILCLERLWRRLADTAANKSDCEAFGADTFKADMEVSLRKSHFKAT